MFRRSRAQILVANAASTLRIPTAADGVMAAVCSLFELRPGDL